MSEYEQRLMEAIDLWKHLNYSVKDINAIMLLRLIDGGICPIDFLEAVLPLEMLAMPV